MSETHVGDDNKQPQPPARIELLDDVLEQRRIFGETLGVVDRTVARMGLPTVYIGGLAYIFKNRSLKLIAERGIRNAGGAARAPGRGPYRKRK